LLQTVSYYTLIQGIHTVHPAGVINIKDQKPAPTFSCQVIIETMPNNIMVFISDGINTVVLSQMTLGHNVTLLKRISFVMPFKI